MYDASSYLQCCIWIFKSCLKFICKESFYITAIQGTSFYPSAKVRVKPIAPLHLLHLPGLAVVKLVV